MNTIASLTRSDPARAEEAVQDLADLFRASFGAKEEDRIRNGKEIWKILVDNVYSIGTVGQSPAFMGVRLVKNNMGNVPDRQVNAQHVRTPYSSQPITFYFK